MKDENCIFCKLANGDIPTNVIYEDDTFTVILDADPAHERTRADPAEGSMRPNIYELPDETAAKVFVLAKKLATKMTEILKCDGFNIVQNNGNRGGADGVSFPYAPDPAVYRGTGMRSGWAGTMQV